MTERKSSGPRRRTRAGVAALAAVLVAAGCDVTNPGPIQDEFLTLKASHEGLVSGAGRRLAQGGANTGYTAMILSREVMPGGQTGSYGWDVLQQGGYFEPGNEGGLGNEFEDLQQARWVAEEALRRFADPAVDASPTVITKAHLYAGYALRLLGENWCEAVLDGSAILPIADYFARGEQHFTDALTTATGDMVTAAYAGRAQIRVWQGNWAGAVSDAGKVPMAFSYAVNLDNVEAATRNPFFWGSGNIPYRSYTTWNTFHADYYDETGDPRAASSYITGLEFSTGALSGYGQVPFRRQLKYQTANDDFRLAGGREMRLIEAEALLVAGDVPGAVAKINEVRTSITSATTGQPLAAVTAGTAAEAWTALMRERNVEMWMEARRMGDLRRWNAAGRPGDRMIPNFEAISPIFGEHPRSQCFDIPDVERDSNPNVPSAVRN